MKSENPIYVTMPSLAPLSEVDQYLRQVWATGVMTHNGPLVRQFERDFSAWSGLPYMVAVANGTLAIQLALRALGLPPGSEVITTPFTFIATLSAILYEGLRPVFVDIDPETFNIDPGKIEAAITPRTSAILPVHVFGNPCDVAAIDAIARSRGLKVVYDAAHAVGVKVDGKSVLAYGDVSATSFHATKLLNTSEGGGIYATDSRIDTTLRELRFFGYDDAKSVVRVGTNAKMTEVNAAIGLANLKHMDEVLADRREKYALYRKLLSVLDGVSFQRIAEGCNFSYFPVVFKSEHALLRVEEALNRENVFPRRYFYPSVNTCKAIVPQSARCPLSESLSSRILCLPLYGSLPKEAIRMIAAVVVKAVEGMK